jgi:hypothetical protein
MEKGGKRFNGDKTLRGIARKKGMARSKEGRGSENVSGG